MATIKVKQNKIILTEMCSDCNSYTLLTGVKSYRTFLKNYWQSILNQKLCILHDTEIPPSGISPRTYLHQRQEQ